MLDKLALYRCTVKTMKSNPTLLQFTVATVTEVHLEGVPQDYAVSQPEWGGIARVTHIPTGKDVYIGPAPVKVFESPAPF